MLLLWRVWGRHWLVVVVVMLLGLAAVLTVLMRGMRYGRLVECLYRSPKESGDGSSRRNTCRDVLQASIYGLCAFSRASRTSRAAEYCSSQSVIVSVGDVDFEERCSSVRISSC